MGAISKLSRFFSLFNADEKRLKETAQKHSDSNGRVVPPSSFRTMEDQFRRKHLPDWKAQERDSLAVARPNVLIEPFDDPKGFIIALINDKGGVGKTTTAVNLAAALAVRSDVLVVDLDRQGSATIALGMEPAKEPFDTIAGVIEGKLPVETVIKASGLDRVDLIPSGYGMTFVENKLQKDTFNELRDILEPLRSKYRYILLDCQPTFTALSGNALAAADGCIVPVSLDHLAIAGIESLTNTFENLMLAEDKLSPLLGIVTTMVDHQLPGTPVKLANVRDAYGDIVFETVIQYDKQLAEAPAMGKSIFEYAGGSRGARCYWALSKEVIWRCKQLRQKQQQEATVEA
ncbi:MAG TPA: hypothetical protein DIW24_05715 [Bacteroidetes bacterium]|nr:hypothetical protein [Bacteroidota bacterium]HRR08951.1 ParA family protein [Rhodothermales bacterium]